MLSLSEVFTAFMVMLGPMKLLGPFAKWTSGMDERSARRVASKAFGFACAGGIAAAVVGENTLRSWKISSPALHLTAGVVLLLVALKTVLAQYEPAPETSMPATFANLAFSPLAFPTILTPHGIATFMLILAVSQDSSRLANVVGLFLIVMVLDVLAMWYARAIVRHGATVLAILGAVLGVLQVALAIQMLLNAFRSLQALAAAQ
jgi:multiple antibiotic resistance protein